MFNIRNYLCNLSVSRVAGIALFIALALLGCDNDTDEEPPKEVVTALVLGAYVPKPVKEGTPTLEIDAEQYTGTIEWTDASDTELAATDKFAVNGVYTAVVKLTANDGFTFTGVAADSFRHTGATSVTNAENKGVVTIIFPAVSAGNIAVTALALETYVPKPVIGEKPATAITIKTPATSQYTGGTIAWKAGDDDKALTASDIFEVDTVYKAVVKLTAKTGYTFTGVKANSFKYTGAEEVTNAADKGEVTITFPEIKVVDDLELDAFVTAPVIDAKPATTVNATATQYTGTIEWTDGDGKKPTKFASGVYTAKVTLTAKDGFTFIGVEKDGFTYTDAEVTNDENSGVVTIIFPEPGDAPDAPLAESLDEFVTRPVLGATPDTTIKEPSQYNIEKIEWKTSAGPFAAPAKFAAGTPYTAVVTLKAKTDGYTFAVLKTTSFKYTGVDNVTKTAGTDTVTVTIPFLEIKNIIVTELALDGCVTRPVNGATVNRVFNPTPTQYTGGTISWVGTLDNNKFVAGRSYTAEVTLKPKTGYTFEGLTENSFTYAGAEKVTTKASGEQVTVTINFLNASSEIPVNTLQPLDHWVVPPIKDGLVASSSKEFEDDSIPPQYHGKITWKREGSGEMPAEFQPNTVYIAVVSLTANDGYTFISVDKSKFTYSGVGVTVDRTANTGEITITFPPTAKAGEPTIINTRLALERVMEQVGIPSTNKNINDVTVASDTPITVTDESRYTAVVEWGEFKWNSFSLGFDEPDLDALFTPIPDADKTDSFKAGKEYTARVTLLPTNNTKFTFTGLPAHSFTYNTDPNVKIDNELNAGTVYIGFPKL
jgi:hypothetical protein